MDNFLAFFIFLELGFIQIPHDHIFGPDYSAVKSMIYIEQRTFQVFLAQKGCQAHGGWKTPISNSFKVGPGSPKTCILSVINLSITGMTQRNNQKREKER